MKQKIYCPDIECDSCVKVLERTFRNLEYISEYKISDDCIYLDFDERKAKTEHIIEAIRNKGYRAYLERPTRKNIGSRIKEFFSDKKKYHIEYRMLKNAAITSAILLILNLSLLYYADVMILKKYAWWVFYLILSIVSLSSAIWHFKTYKTEHTCMVGMMIGMTLGMQTGMMVGAVIGATNGFFIGAMTGMLMGVFIGAYCGKCCGIMGAMEGMMAGIMGGTMGPMITLMMFNEHLLWFMPVFMILNSMVLAGLSYMIFEEVAEDKRNVIIQPMSFYKYFLLSAVLLIIAESIMFLAPLSIYLS